jgi:heavy metal translocating P-type ATPase
VNALQTTNPHSTPQPVACEACDLCGLKLPRHPYIVDASSKSYRFCCAGCRQVFVLLSESGLFNGDYKNSDLYQTSLRLGIIGQPDDDLANELSQSDLAGTQELVLRVDGMWCSSCSWLIEKVVRLEPGIVHSRVIYASDTAKVYYRPEQIGPERIASVIEKLGYKTTSRETDSDAFAADRRSLLIRMGVALFLMMNAMFFSYTMYIGYFQELAPEIRSLVPYILFGLSTPAVFWCGSSIHRKGIRSLLAKAPTMEALFSIGIMSAYSYSIYSAFHGQIHLYFDTATGLVALLLVGKFIELSAKGKASENVLRLYQMLPKKVRIRAPEGERLVSIEKLDVGHTFIVKSGEKIPADGRVLMGRAIVDESLLTGEAMPIEKGVGDTVIASSMNNNGILEIEAVRIGQQTVLSNIIRMVEHALSTKSSLEEIVDRVVKYFIPAVISLAFFTALGLLATGSDIEAAMVRAISVLVVACPCALGMATPLAIAGGIGYAAKSGILIRDGAALQLAGKVDTLVFDKTGTITEGKFSLARCWSLDADERRALTLVASLEQSSNHPIANAIVEAAKQQGLRLSVAEEVTIHQGEGLEGTVDGLTISVGTPEFVRERQFVIDAARQELVEPSTEAGQTLVYFGIQGSTLAGYLVLGDTVKSTAKRTVESLDQLGVAMTLLSGDSEKTTAAVAKSAGINNYRGRSLPSDKIEFIRNLQSQHATVAMVGDGVNDSPALAQSDVGIAMAEGTELAIQSASITLLRDDLTLIPEAIGISRRTLTVIKQNLVWAFLYNSIGVVIAMLGLLNPFIAAGAMLASSLSVVGNSMRLGAREGVALRRVVEIFFPWLEPRDAKVDAPYH